MISLLLDNVKFRKLCGGRKSGLVFFCLAGGIESEVALVVAWPA